MMECVTVKKADLKTKIQANRDKHRTAYSEALEGYTRVSMQTLEATLEAFRAGQCRRLFINEQPPEDHTNDYDRVLMMLEMSVHDEVTLDEARFSQYVQDDWGWKKPWIASNSKYLSG